ncbi:CaiB/BaiF CoA transferase family protein [Sphingopyxis indica]|uniref:Benzylsuccinate CoA-transferase BbsF subunit n=1 Tax=Sphingopyxis indica TaxID=436663 RepID=A0A239HBZ3_9SPHN|nr:CoA transferase [Sphingopyxis indica]SNS78919.1 benzylsuccinate CoA-transferase BbsF subunit [Sphingopyxis indica]
MNLPLSGLRVIDMGWLMAGPHGARYLADLGADVIKVESGKRLDPLRGLGPYQDGQPGLNRSLSYHMTNAGKRSIAVDVKQKEGVELVKRLVATADVFVESFTPGQIDKMGLSYALLAEKNPGLIMVSSGLLGRKGSMGMGMSGTGLTGSAYSGATNLVGWPDRAPAGPYGPWTDAVAPRFLAVSVLAALHRRRATGCGTHIDLSQAEAGLQFLAPAYYDYAANGHIAGRVGDAIAPLNAPSGLYPCAGDDCWVAIDAVGHKAWSALRKRLAPALDAKEFDTLVGRLRARASLDAAIAGWTRHRSAREIETMLQAEGIAAHVVSSDADLGDDPNLEALGHYEPVFDPLLGDIVIPAPSWRLSADPRPARCPGPILGAAGDEILREVLGLTGAQIDELREANVLG